MQWNVRCNLHRLTGSLRSVCIDYNGGYIEDKGLDFCARFFKGSDGGTIPERDGAISKIFFFFNKSQCKSKKTNKFLQFEDKGTQGTYCTEGGRSYMGVLKTTGEWLGLDVQLCKKKKKALE